MNRLLVALIYLGWTALPVLAHTGHHDRIMGTVSTIQDSRLEVKTSTGETSSVDLTEKTKVLRGKVTVKRADIRTGDRVVVTAMSMKGSDGKPKLMAEEVRLGIAPVEQPKTRK